MQSSLFEVDVSGELACFTRPEAKVERLSYPCPTPSAARGILEAIFSQRTDFKWRIWRIEILNPIKFLPLRRNEVKEKINVTSVVDWLSRKSDPEPIWADGDRELTGTDEKGRTQRQTIALKDVRYRIAASIQPWPGMERKLASLESQFTRRVANGKCFYQPYLGCREFPAYFQFANAERAKPVDVNLHLGLMLYDVFDLSRPCGLDERPNISLFQARIDQGVLEIPDYNSSEVLKTTAGEARCSHT